MNKISDESSSC